jgi:hypothetical protein
LPISLSIGMARSISTEDIRMVSFCERCRNTWSNGRYLTTHHSCVYAGACANTGEIAGVFDPSRYLHSTLLGK